MIITNEILENFGACNGAKSAFAVEFPDGLDISACGVTQISVTIPG